MSIFPPRWLCGLLPLLALLFGLSRPLPAQSTSTEEPVETEPPIPLVVTTIANIDNSLADIAWMFQAAERSDMMEMITGLLNEKAGNLKGFDRKRPLGAAVFLQTDSLPPRPAVISFVPIENLQDALKTLALTPGSASARKISGREDLLEIINSNGDKTGPVLRIVGDYAYVTDQSWQDMLDNLPDLQSIMTSLSSRYDAAVTVRIKAVPQGVRQVFVNFLRAQSEIELQRKDDEPEAAYLVRRANGISTLDSIDQLLMQGEELTLGWDARPEERVGVLEFSVNATPDSEFAKAMSAVASKPSMFGILRQEGEPLTANISWVWNQREIKAMKGMLEATKTAISKPLASLSGPGSPIERMFDSLHATVDAGHFDAFLQFRAVDVRKFVLLGGVKLVGGQAFGTALGDVVDGVSIFLQERVASGNAAGEIPEIQARAETHQGIVLHRLTPPGDRDSERFFGGAPDIYFGASSRALWVTIGTDEALPSLRDAIDRVLTSPPPQREPGGNVPFQLTAHVAPWLKLPQDEIRDPVPNAETTPEQLDQMKQRVARRRARQEDQHALAEEAFREADTLRIDAKPSESGIRFRITLDEGFVKMLGMMLSRAYDESQL